MSLGSVSIFPGINTNLKSAPIEIREESYHLPQMPLFAASFRIVPCLQDAYSGGGLLCL